MQILQIQTAYLSALTFWLWLVGVTVWIIDQVACDYIGHWGGHAMWHICTGTGVFFLNEALKEVRLMGV